MRILITGGSSGLGRAVVERLSENPDNYIFFTYCRKESEARQLSEQHNNVESIKVDFTDSASVDSFVEIIPSFSLDSLVNNAWVGSPNGTYFHKTSISDFETSFNNNIVPLIKITQACISQFRKQKRGKIVTVLTSSLLNLPPMGYSVYSATKAYIEQLSKCWCKENARFGITANCVSPEYMLTSFSNVDERVIEQMASEHPLKSLLRPDEVAEVIVMLLQSSSQVNGVNIPINAAQSILK
jgi:NAD(P)-dependent dehydrogenase (short-subunit alcohol dehydrogenase family)